MSTERRQHHRLPIDNIAVQSGVISGRVLDLSACGIGIETSSGMKIGTRHRLRITTAEKVVLLVASVRWCRLDRLRPKNSGDVVPIYRTGLSIGQRLPLP